MSFCFPPPVVPAIPLAGSDLKFPVRRIFCIGRNYSDHVREMGFDPKREEPFFFTKPADALVTDGATIDFPLGSANVHHEVELVAAIGRQGSNIPVERAQDHIFGYAVGNDLTRRDLQIAARDRGRPWDISKAFDQSAHVAPLVPVKGGAHLKRARIKLAVNGEIRQDSDIAEMVWSVPELVAHLSRFQVLVPGDIVYTGTPAGVGPLKPGDTLEASIEGLPSLTIHIAHGGG